MLLGLLCIQSICSIFFIVEFFMRMFVQNVKFFVQIENIVDLILIVICDFSVLIMLGNCSMDFKQRELYNAHHF